MTAKEKYFELKDQLDKASIEWEQEKFMENDHYWTIGEGDKLKVTTVYYNGSTTKQIQLTQKQKELVCDIYFTLKS